MPRLPRLAPAHRLLGPGAVTYPPGEAGAERQGRWGRGMASCAAQGGWNKRRRRGRRKKLGEESSGREGSGRRGRWSRGAGASRAGRGGALRPVVAELGDPGEEEWGWGVGEGSRDGHVECLPWRWLRWQRGERAWPGGGEWAGVRAALRPDLRRQLRPDGAAVLAATGVGW